MSLRFPALAFATLICAAVTSAQVGDPLPPLVRKAMNVASKLKFSGQRKVSFKVRGERVTYVEYIRRDGTKTRLEFPDPGPYSGQVIVETSRERRHYFPEQNKIFVMPPRREESYNRLLRLLQKAEGERFVITMDSGFDTIAGVSSREFIVKDPKGNLVQRMWIDPNTGALLKRELYDRSGNLQGGWEFQRINFAPKLHPTDFVLKVNGAVVVTQRDVLADLIKKNGFQRVMLNEKDPYRLEMAHIAFIEKKPALVQVYVQPKQGRVSLFQVKAAVDEKSLKRFARGDYRVLSWQREGTSFVLVGDVSDDELRRIARRLGAPGLE